MNGRCKKCGTEIKDINQLEEEELTDTGSFVCSDCIQDEMAEEQMERNHE